MNIFHAVKQSLFAVMALVLAGMPVIPALAADINYDADTNLTVNSVNLVILSGSHASRLVIGSTLIVDVPAGENFFLVSRDGTALPNTVSVSGDNQASITQVCTQNAQGQSTENILSILGATAGTKTVTITPTAGTKCQNAGGVGSSGGGGGGGGAGSSGGGSAATSGTLPPAPTVIPGVTPTAPSTTPAAPATPSVSVPSAPAPAPAVPIPPTAVEIKEQASTRTDAAIERFEQLLSQAQAAAPAAVEGKLAPVISAPKIEVSRATEVLVGRILPSSAPPIFAAVTKFLLNDLPPAVAAKGAGEFAGAINSTITANNGVIPSDPQEIKDVVTNATLVVNGRFPLDKFKNPDLESKSLERLALLYKRDLNPGEDTKKALADRNAVVVAAYGLRQQKRNLRAETSCERSVTAALVRPRLVISKSAEYWNMVNACAYSGATR